MLPRTDLRVFILNPDACYCSLLRAVLDNAPDFAPATVYSNHAEIAARRSGKGPDVVLVDISLANPSPADLLRQLKTRWPAAALLILTDLCDEASVLASFQAGASGYLLKNTPLARICEAIKEAQAGGCPISPQVARRLAEWFHANGGAAVQPAQLSAREQEVLDLVAVGGHNRAIASTLKLSEATVRAHLRQIFVKLNVRSRAEAVARMNRSPKS